MYGERGYEKEKITGRNFSAEGKIYVKNVHGDFLLNLVVRSGQSTVADNASYFSISKTPWNMTILASI